MYAAIEGNILTAAQGERKTTFLITSSVVGEGKTFATLVMAEALAVHSNAKVLLIEGNVHNPMLAQAFDIKEVKGGVFEYFACGRPLEDVIISSGYPNIFLMPLSNQQHCNAERCFHHKIFSQQLEKLKETDFDYVLVDGSAVMGFSDSLAIAQFFDSVILVIECEKTKWEIAQFVSEKLTMVKGKQLGTILNKRTFHIPSKLYG